MNASADPHTRFLLFFTPTLLHYFFCTPRTHTCIS
jgi:hypothetical protein